MRAIKFKIYRGIAFIILFLFGRGKSTKGKLKTIPYPFLSFVIGNTYGPWAGVSLYLEGRKREYLEKRKVFMTKLKNVLIVLSILFILSILIFLSLMDFRDISNFRNGFWFGFFQNFFSDVIVGVAIAYWFTRYLESTRRRILEFSGIYRLQERTEENWRIFCDFSAYNLGNTKYQEQEVYVDLLVDSRIQKIENDENDKVLKFLGMVDHPDRADLKFKRFAGYIPNPIFPKSNYLVLQVKGLLPKNIDTSDLKVYCSASTAYGFYPEVGPTDIEFLDGAPFERIDQGMIYKEINFFEAKIRPYMFVDRINPADLDMV